MSYLGLCQTCGQPVDDATQTACFQVTGFEVSRAKGLNRLLHKKRVPGKVWHLTCAEELPNRNQTNLFGQAA